MSDEFTEMAIQQLHLSYSGHQDRMLLKVSLADEGELNAWLTRRIVKTLWSLLQENELSPTHESMSMPVDEFFEQFNHEAGPLLEGIDFSGQENMMPPMLEAEEHEPPVLITACKLVQVDHLESMLELYSQAGEAYSIALTAEINHALSSMLQLATQEAAWDLGFTTDRIVLADEAAQFVLH